MNQRIDLHGFPTWEALQRFILDQSSAFRGWSREQQHHFLGQVIDRYQSSGPLTSTQQEQVAWLQETQALLKPLPPPPAWRPGLKQGVLTVAAAQRLGRPELAGQTVDYSDSKHPGELASEVFYQQVFIRSMMYLGADGIVPLPKR